jgi:hypothetical protein
MDNREHDFTKDDHFGCFTVKLSDQIWHCSSYHLYKCEYFRTILENLDKSSKQEFKGFTVLLNHKTLHLDDKTFNKDCVDICLKYIHYVPYTSTIIKQYALIRQLFQTIDYFSINNLQNKILDALEIDLSHKETILTIDMVTYLIELIATYKLPRLTTILFEKISANGNIDIRVRAINLIKKHGLSNSIIKWTPSCDTQYSQIALNEATDDIIKTLYTIANTIVMEFIVDWYLLDTNNRKFVAPLLISKDSGLLLLQKGMMIGKSDSEYRRFSGLYLFKLMKAINDPNVMLEYVKKIFVLPKKCYNCNQLIWYEN